MDTGKLIMIAIGGFVLTDEDVATLEPAPDARWVIS